MERKIICPEGWQAIYYPAHVVTDPKRFVFCSGMVSKDENGKVVHVGDIAGQSNKALDNVEAALHEAGMNLRGKQGDGSSASQRAPLRSR